MMYNNIKQSLVAQKHNDIFPSQHSQSQGEKVRIVQVLLGM